MKPWFKLIPVFFLLLSSFDRAACFAWSGDSSVLKNEPLLKPDSVQQRIAEQVLLFPQEKLYLHTDRSQYVSGEQLWFRVYLLDAVLHMPSSRNAYVHVELLSPADSVLARVLVGHHGGTFSGRLDLDPDLAGGDYVLRAYTDRGQPREPFDPGSPVFLKKINILSPRGGDGNQTMTASQDVYEVSFYPEGGYLTEGPPNRVAFKALYSDGAPAAIRGRLVDDTGMDHGPVQTLRMGMGVFELQVGRGKQYFLLCENEQGGHRKFPLPAVEQGAQSLQASIRNGELQVSVRRAADINRDPAAEPQGPLYLLLHTRGMVHYMEAWDDNYTGIAFDTDLFPSGVLQILLLDEEARPLSERLVFCRKHDDAPVSLDTDQEAYRSRSRVQADVRITDPDGQSRSGSFSVAVTDDYDVSPDEEQNILAAILLGSELRGNIPDPAYYLRPENWQELDVLMMTHGWRRYNIPEVIRQRYAKPPKTAASQGLAIRGTVTTDDTRQRPLPDRKVSILSWQTGYSDETLTDSLGRFAFKGLEFADSISFVVQAETPQWRNHPRLNIEQDSFPKVSGIAAAYQADKPRERGSRTIQEEVKTAYVIEKSLRHTARHGLREIEIEEVKIEAPQDSRAGESFSYYMPKNSREGLGPKQLEEIQPMSLSDALHHIPTITVTGGQVYIHSMMRNSMGGPVPAVLIIDDIVMRNVDDIDNLLDPVNIERIGVLKGAGAVLLGGRGAGGAIVITTRKGLTRNQAQRYQREDIRVVSPLGLQSPAEFYAPVYETAEQRNRREPDLRTTIYWNPDVKVSPAGEASFVFYTADTSATYTLVIEGVTDNGQLIRHVARISRK